MRELKKNRQVIVKGDNSGFPAVSNKKVDHLLYNAQCNLERKKVCKFYCTTTTGLFFNSQCWASIWQEELNLVERCILL